MSKKYPVVCCDYNRAEFLPGIHRGGAMAGSLKIFYLSTTLQSNIFFVNTNMYKYNINS
jgi:hypothetical protein